MIPISRKTKLALTAWSMAQPKEENTVLPEVDILACGRNGVSKQAETKNHLQPPSGSFKSNGAILQYESLPVDIIIN